LRRRRNHSAPSSGSASISGLRSLAEALTLRWENVDLESGFLTVEAAYAKGKQTDTLPINRILVDALARLKRTAVNE
jgi:integrase